MPGRIGSPTRRSPGTGEQPVDERAVGVAGARMDDEARLLVDDDHVVVLVDDADLDRRVGLRHAAHRDRRRVDPTPAPRARRACPLPTPPSTRPPPSATTAAAAERDVGDSATTRSSRSPSSAAGTSRDHGRRRRSARRRRRGASGGAEAQ